MILVDLKFSHEKRCDLPFTLFFLLLALKALHKSQNVKRFVCLLFTTGKFSRFSFLAYLPDRPDMTAFASFRMSNCLRYAAANDNC